VQLRRKRVQMRWQKSRASKNTTKFKIVVNLLNVCRCNYYSVEDSTCLLKKGLYFCISCSFYISRPCHNDIKVGKYDIITFIMLENIGCSRSLIIEFLIMTLAMCNHCIQDCSIGFQFRTILFLFYGICWIVWWNKKPNGSIQ
jgi:hypothetical protein